MWRHRPLPSRLLNLERRVAVYARRRIGATPAGGSPLALDAWARQYLPDYFTYPLSSFHRWLTAQLQELHRRRGSRMVLVAPRGSAKSTWVSLAYPLWVALHQHESYILLISDTAQANMPGKSSYEGNASFSNVGAFLQRGRKL